MKYFVVFDGEPCDCMLTARLYPLSPEDFFNDQQGEQLDAVFVRMFFEFSMTLEIDKDDVLC